MIRAVTTLCLALGLSLALGASPASAGGHPRMMLGPGDAKVHDIKDQALIRTSAYGYIFIAGQQNTRLTVTYDKAKNTLRYHDRGTKRLTSIPKSCQRVKVKQGIAAVCKVPAKFNSRSMFVQVWPRLGNDHIDGHTLPSRFRLWVLADAGNDVVYGGAGTDFVNGAKGNDTLHGGHGNDFLRSGPGHDHVVGGPGADKCN